MSIATQFQNQLLTRPAEQLKVINEECGISRFDEKLTETGLYPLSATGIEVFQVNLGKMCNLTCKHCHVDAGPHRKEIMSQETMQHCLGALERTGVPAVDLTGGAPEMNPHFKWFVTEIKKRRRHVMVRSNLTILVTAPFADYPEFFKENRIEVIASLPYYLAENTDAQRGDGVFEKSIRALRRLNDLGYGQPDSGLLLDLVYNPTGAFLPPKQAAIEADYKKELKERYGVVFNNLYTITNMPINRFLTYLIRSRNYNRYMRRLHDSYNPTAAANVMCRTMLSVGWDGYLYDCDFNQMLNLTVNHTAPSHIKSFDFDKLARRRIVTGQHCYGCTAGAGSSCGGAIAEE